MKQMLKQKNTAIENTAALDSEIEENKLEADMKDPEETLCLLKRKASLNVRPPF